MATVFGTANLAAGLRDAHLSCTPLIAITGGAYSHTRDRHTYQQVEDLPLFKPVTKYSADVDDIRRLPDVIRQAFRAATTGTRMCESAHARGRAPKYPRWRLLDTPYNKA